MNQTTNLSQEIEKTKLTNDCIICGSSPPISLSKIQVENFRHVLENVIESKDCLSFCKTCHVLIREMQALQQEVASIEDMLIRLVKHKTLHQNSGDVSQISCESCDFVTNSEIILISHSKHHEILVKRGSQFGVEEVVEVKDEERESEDEMLEEKPISSDDDSEFNIPLSRLVVQKNQRKRQLNFQCDDCGMKFRLRAELKQHVDMHSEEYIAKCFFCLYITNKRANLTVHMHTKHKLLLPLFNQIDYDDNNLLTCKKCGAIIKNPNRFCSHDGVKQEGTLKLQCGWKNCKEEFYKENLLKNHKSDVHNVCSYCEQHFERRETCLAHIKKHTLENLFECEICTKKFVARQGLNNHTKQFHSNEHNFECEICHEKFFIKTRYDYHMIKHNKISKYICNICGRQFQHSSTYSMHRRWHDNPTPFHCKECGEKFVYKKLMENHIRKVHTGEKPFICTHCGKSFLTDTNFKRHMFIHVRDNLPFNCRHCHKGFIRKRDYGNHLAKAHNDLSVKDSKYVCEYKMALPKSDLFTRIQGECHEYQGETKTGAAENNLKEEKEHSEAEC